MSFLVSFLLAFCLSIAPEASWDCNYIPGYGATCDNGESDYYYRAHRVYYEDSFGGTVVITLTDGDSYESYVDQNGIPWLPIP